MIKTCDVLIIGAGPAGLVAAKEAAQAGAQVLLLERSNHLGGQLIKQTHKFFGSKEEFAGERGVAIAERLLAEVGENPGIEVWCGGTALGIYQEDGIVTAEYKGVFHKIKAKRLIVATGAAEKTLPFPNSDLPGIYGAGAVQTLMNVHGVLPGKRIVMLGAGNIGVIVAYQLLQAGVEVAAIVEGAPVIGSYWVHASKVRRCGVPIYTSHTIVAAHGKESLEAVTIGKVDEKWQVVPGSEQTIEADGLCLSVGLSPLTELLWQAGCDMTFVKELGGYVPWRDANLMTSKKEIFVAGDVAGVEEASAAMVEGKIAGLYAAFSLGMHLPDFQQQYQQAKGQLAALRSGPTSAKVCKGLCKVTFEEAM